MTETTTYLVLAILAPVAVGITMMMQLRGWEGWLALKRMELAGGDGGRPRPAGDRIELADLRERVRKLEAIASCVDL